MEWYLLGNPDIRFYHKSEVLIALRQRMWTQIRKERKRNAGN